MKDQDIINEEERHEAATETPIGESKSEVEVEELKKRGSKLKACNDRSYAKMVRIAELANECVQRTTHAEYEPGQYGRDYMAFGKAICEIRSICKYGLASDFPDYEWMADMMTSEHFDPNRLAQEIDAKASEKPVDYPTFYTPGWLAELAKKTQSDRDREEARRKRKIHWACYPTKVDVCAMGKTEQNGKVYEVRISKRGDSKVQDTYGQCKVNGKTVLTCSFTGSAWMLKRILTEGMQALVNYKAKRNRDSRRNYAKRRAAANQELINKELA